MSSCWLLSTTGDSDYDRATPVRLAVWHGQAVLDHRWRPLLLPLGPILLLARPALLQGAPWRGLDGVGRPAKRLRGAGMRWPRPVDASTAPLFNLMLAVHP